MNQKPRKKIIKAILESLKGGTSIVTACDKAGVVPVTFWRWRQADLELEKTTIAIIDSRIQMVEDALYKSAINGHIAAQIFFLKNRASHRWKDTPIVINTSASIINTHNQFNLQNLLRAKTQAERIAITNRMAELIKEIEPTNGNGNGDTIEHTGETPPSA